MKKLLLISAFVAITGSAFAQSVIFANTGNANFRLMTNNASGTALGLMSASNPHRVGLYTAAGGSASESSLVLVGMTTNSANAALNGYFNGGNPFLLPSPAAAGDVITFQLRTWQVSGGLTFAEAILAGSSTGKSALGSTTLGGGPAAPGALFGTGAGQVGSFTSVTPIPEPSSIAIGLLGLGAIALFRRRK